MNIPPNTEYLSRTISRSNYLPKLAANCLFSSKPSIFSHFQNAPFVCYFRDIVHSDEGDISRGNVATKIQSDRTMRHRRKVAISLMDTSGNEDLNVAEEMIKTWDCKIRTWGKWQDHQKSTSFFTFLCQNLNTVWFWITNIWVRETSDEWTLFVCYSDVLQ